MNKLKNKIRINKLKSSFVRDRFGSVTPCHWNQMIKEEILELEK